MNYKEELLKKISSHTAKIGIIGLGYVGLLLAVEFGKKFAVTCIHAHAIGIK